MRNLAHINIETKNRASDLALQEAIQSWDSLMEQLPVAIYICDREGILRKYNKMAADLWGRAPKPGDPQAKYCGAYKAYYPSGDVLPLENAPMSEVLRTQQPVRDREVIVQRPDGTIITILANLDPLFDRDGHIIGGVNCFQDISVHKRAEEELCQSRALLHESENRFRILLESLPAAVYTTDKAGHITFYNEAAAELWGCEPELGKSQWCGSWRIYTRDGAFLPHEACPMAEALKEDRAIRDAEAIAERPDGTRVPFAAYPTPLHDTNGQLVGAVNMLVDITHRKHAEKRQQLLINELNHRVKNTLAIVQSIASQTFRGDASGQAARWFEGRLIALSKAHDILTRENWEGAGLYEIISQTMAYLRDENEKRFEMKGPNVRLSPKLALTLAMTLHELCTNAVKYGAISTPTGSVSIEWHIRPAKKGKSLYLRWEEKGGPSVGTPQHKGFGTRLIERGFASELGAAVRLAFAKSGVVCEIETTLSED